MVRFFNDDLDDEYWTTYKDFYDYRVSNMGRVKFVSKNKILSIRDGKSYKTVSLRKNKKSHVFKVHRLILLSFVGDCPQGMVGCHNNGNNRDNRLENLRWDTTKNNVKDKFEHGTQACGENNPLSKLTENDIFSIRAIPRYRGLYAKLAKHYGVTEGTIATIRNRKSWKHI